MFDASKAENRNLNNSDHGQTDFNDLNPWTKKEEKTFDLANINPILEDELKQKTKLDIDYLEPKNELEDYIVDTGDSLFIDFKNKPRGPELLESEFDPEDSSYLNPRSDLKNYILDSNDVLEINFIYVPEFNSIQEIDKNGEIYLPELGAVYLRGLNIYQVKDLLEKKYEEYLKLTDLEIRINKFRFVKSGIYMVNDEGELYLPLLEEIYVRGLTTNEISNLLSRKYLNSEKINAEIKIRISKFKPQRILITGEVRNPGIYKFPSYSSGEFSAVENINFDTSSKEGMGNLTRSQFSSSESNIFLNQDSQNNNTIQSFQIKRPSENFNTISNVIKKAGGITSKTDLSRIEIIRDIPFGKGGGKKKAIVDFTSFVNNSDASNDIRLFDGDRLFIPELASPSPEILPKSILTGLSPRFITVDIFGRVENPGTLKLPLESALSDAIDLSGPIKPLSGKIVLIRYNKDGTIINQNISYSARAKRGSKRNPFIKQDDLISVKNSFLGKSTGIIKEFTAPFVGIYSTKEILESFND